MHMDNDKDVGKKWQRRREKKYNFRYNRMKHVNIYKWAKKKNYLDGNSLTRMV